MDESGDYNNILINGRSKRIDALFSIIKLNPGNEGRYYRGRFFHAYRVKERTYYEYMRCLIDEGKVIRVINDADTQPTYWTQAAWAEHMEAMKADEIEKERAKMRAMSGKMDEFVEAKVEKA